MIRPHPRRQRVTLALAFFVCSALASAATSTAWQVSGFTDFTKGHLTGLSVSTDGVLQVGPAIRFKSDLTAASAWSVTPAPDGGVYVGTGNNGRLLHVAPDGKPDLIWTSPQPEIFALATGSNGLLYVGTSPNGGVYRIENGQAQQIWHSPDKYIWAIVPAPDDSLYIATGEQGSVYHLQKDGTAQVYFQTGQLNVTSLTLGPSGHLYAGTDPNGLLYDITGPQKATVVFDSTLPEIRSIVVNADGTVYAAAMGGAVATRTGTTAAGSLAAPTTPVTATAPTVVTVTEGANSDQQSAVTPPAQGQASSSTSSAVAAASQSGIVEVSGVEKSAIYKISPDHIVETLRSSKEENTYDLLLDNGSILFSTDVRGRVYRLSDRKTTTLVSELADGVTTRLVSSRGTLYALMSNPGRVLALTSSAGPSASFESQVHDSVSVARWGHLQWHGTGTGVTFQTRTGFSARPDNTWNPWTALDPQTSRILSPPARFIQFRAQWEQGSTAQINSIDLPYLPQNGPPAVHSITVTSVTGQNPAKAGNTNAATANQAYSITVTDTGEAPAASTGSSASQTASRLQSTQTQISWQADDPDADKLVYSVYFRAEEAADWQLVRSRMFENTLLLDPDVFADGRYFFRVVASDAPTNAPTFAQQSELVSAPVLIDNTPPDVTVGPPDRKATVLDIDVKATDKTSPLRLCEYSLDAGSWQPIDSSDGVTDSPQESFHLHLDHLRPGEHLVVFRAYDAAGNAGLAKVLLH